MTGFEVARRARAAGNYVPILILTAKDDAARPRARHRGGRGRLPHQAVHARRAARARARAAAPAALGRRARADAAPARSERVGPRRRVHFDRFELETPEGAVRLTHARDRPAARAHRPRGRGRRRAASCSRGLGAARPTRRRAWSTASSCGCAATSRRIRRGRATSSRCAGTAIASCAEPRAMLHGARRATCHARSVSDASASTSGRALRDASLLLAFEGWNDAGEAATRRGALRRRGACRARRSRRSTPRSSTTSPWPPAGARWTTAACARSSGRPSRSATARAPTRRELVIGDRHRAAPALARASATRCSSSRARSRVRRVVLLGAFLADVVYSRPVRVIRLRERGRDLLERARRRSRRATRARPASSACSASGCAATGVEIVSLWAGLPALHRAPRRTRAARSRCVQKASPAPRRSRSTTRRCAASAAEFEERVSALGRVAIPRSPSTCAQLKKREFAQ